MAGGANKGRPHSKTFDRMRIAIRLQLRNLGLTNNEIAAHIGISPTAFSILQKTSHYKILKNQYLTGILSDLDSDIEASLKLGQKTLNQAVPKALENLYALACQTADPKLQLQASTEILDRHGRFAKVSRIGLPTQDQGESASVVDNDVANALVANLGKAKAVADFNTLDPNSTTTN